MSQPSDHRNARPTAGSALWWYLWSVVVLAVAVIAVSLAGLHDGDVAALVRRPAFWLVAAPMAVTAFRPVVPKGRGGDGTFALVVFLFALLLHVGLPAAVFLCTITMLVRGALFRQALHRNLFNVGQHVLTLGAAWLVLRSFNIDPSPRHPWMFSEPHIRVSELVAVGLAGLAYLVVNNGSVYVAIAMMERRSLVAIVREDVRHLAVVGVAMVSLVAARPRRDGASVATRAAVLSGARVALPQRDALGGSASTTPCTTRSPASATGSCCTARHRAPWSSCGVRARASLCSCSTSTGSRRSTTPSVTPRATGCFRSSPSGCARAAARRRRRPSRR